MSGDIYGILGVNTSSMLQVSLPARQLIHALLQRDPVDRLGSNNGANDIKQHSFFRGINWPLIRCMVLICINFICLLDDLTNQMDCIRFTIWSHSYCFSLPLKTPPPLEAPLELIKKDPKAKDVKWEDGGVLVSSMDLDLF